MVSLPAMAATDVLMVADEIPAMEVLAKQLKTRIGKTSEITTQDKMPADLSVYPVVMVYIHQSIGEPAGNSRLLKDSASAGVASLA